MSEINPFILYDYLEEARSRTTEQFKEKLVFDKYLQLMLNANIELQEVFRELMQERSLDTAVGAQLDIIGDIVGQPREFIDTALIEYFAFDGYPDAQSYGDLNDTSIGGFYYSLDQPLAGNTLLNDTQYRLFIKAKIIKNNTQATPNQFLEFISFVFGATVNNVVAEGNASFTVMVGKELNSFERALLTYTSTYNGYASPFVPKPIGVRVNFGQFNYDNYFGYQGAPNAKGYGDLSVNTNSPLYNGEFLYNSSISYSAEPLPLVGGKYATLF